MVLKPVKNINSAGITLVEIIVVIFIIALFSAIVIADFPTIQKHFVLSRASYQLAQDLRKIQDLGLSGVQTKDMIGSTISVQGYGIYINTSQSREQYVMYADVYDGDSSDNQVYSGNQSYPLCSQTVNPKSDCVLAVTDIGAENPDLYIKHIRNIISTYTSINFSPPDPVVSIDNICTYCSDNSEIGIVLGLHSDSSAERTVWIKNSGLISVE